MKKNKRIYVAGPYSHTSSSVRSVRQEFYSRAAADLIKSGHLVFSPISHGYNIEMSGVDGDAKTWEGINNSILKRWATHVYVYMIPGWKESKGLLEEIKTAKKLGLKIKYIECSFINGLKIFCNTIANINKKAWDEINGN